MAKLMFTSPQKNWVFRIAFLASLLAFAFILLSTYTHTLNLSISSATQAQTYLIASVCALILVLTYLTLHFRHFLTDKPFIICLGLIFLAGCLLALNNKMIFSDKFQPLVVLVRLFIEIMGLSFLWWLSQITRPNAYSFTHRVSSIIRLGAWLGLFMIFLQITLGTWISTNYTGFMCLDFPYCHGELFPMVDVHHLFTTWLAIGKINDELLTAINSLHRLSAIVMGVYIGLFSLALFLNRQLIVFGVFFLLLLAAEVGIGIFNIGTTKSIFLAVSQNAITTVFLLTIISLLINLYRKPQDYWYS